MMTYLNRNLWTISIRAARVAEVWATECTSPVSMWMWWNKPSSLQICRQHQLLCWSWRSTRKIGFSSRRNTWSVQDVRTVRKSRNCVSCVHVRMLPTALDSASRVTRPSIETDVRGMLKAAKNNQKKHSILHPNEDRWDSKILEIRVLWIQASSVCPVFVS